MDPPTPIMQRAVNLKLTGYTRARGPLQEIENDDDIANFDDNIHTKLLGKVFEHLAPNLLPLLPPTPPQN